MQKEVPTKIEIPEFLVDIYRDMAISPLDLLENYASSMIKNKISKYEA